MADPHAVQTADERTQLETFLDAYRRLLAGSLDGLTEDEARRRLVPSETTLLGLVKHVTYVERVWFGATLSGVPRERLGLAPTPHESFLLTADDTIDTVLAAHRDACAESVRIASGLLLDDVVTHSRFGPMTVRWVLIHLVRELAQHCGHADVLREQVLHQRA